MCVFSYFFHELDEYIISSLVSTVFIYYECLICPCTCINVFVSVCCTSLWGLLDCNWYRASQWGELSTTRHLRSTLRGGSERMTQTFQSAIQPSNYRFLSRFQISLQLPFSQPTPQIATYLTLTSPLLAGLLFFLLGRSQISVAGVCSHE